MIIHSFRTVRSNVVKRKIISAFLTFLLLFQNVAPVAQLSIVMAQDATPVVEQVQPTPAPESTPAPETTPTPEAPPVPAETPAPEAIVEPTPVLVPTPPSDSASVEEPTDTQVPAFNPTDVLGIPLNIPTLQPEVPAVQEPELVVQECLLDDAQIKETVSTDWTIDLEEGIATTNDKVQLGVKYIFPQENKVSVTFKCLPKDESLRSPLKIQQVKVSDLKLPNATKVDGEYAYDITTDMKDGDFAYDVTLPKSENKNASVSYIEKSIDEAKQEVKAEDFKTVSETDTTKVNQELKGEDITATGMDHFTIFVVVYNSQPAVIPGSFPSVGFQATSTFEFGDHLLLAGTDRSAERITVGMTNWACENDFTFTDGNWVKNRADNEACVTTPGSSYIHPLTLNVYEADTSGVVPVVGSLVLTKTINAAIPFRPSYDQQCTAPGSDSPFGGTWFDSISNSCVHGFNFDAVFDLAGQTLPDNVIVTIAFNTQSYGLNPIGQNGPYNSLNMSVGNVSASAGTNVNPDDVFQYSTHAPNYTDGGASGVGILRQDTGWSGYVPVIKVEVTAPPQVSCGDGVVNQESEQCDYGTSNGSSNCSQSCQWVSSCSEVMAVNGSFETPVVTNGALWDAFDNAIVPGWTAAWIGGSTTYSSYTRPEPKIELHRGVLGAAAQDEQYAELDSDWGGPDQNYSGEPASIALSQTIPTIVGNQYTVSWRYAPRPNHTNNHLQVTIDGSEVFNSGVIGGASGIIWLTESKTFTATTTTTVISFNELGTADSFGMFLDDVTVSCQGPPVCTEGPTWASSVVSSTQGKLKNGNTITDPLRTDPLQVLGANDNKFFSLGYGGEIIVSFAGFIVDKPNEMDLSFHEITNGRDSYPEERANIQVSQDNSNYVDLGYVTNKDGVGGVAYKDLAGSGLGWIKYVKITDATNDPALEATADGYDLDAVDATQQVCEEPEPRVSAVTVCKEDGNKIGLSDWSVFLKGETVQTGLSVPSNTSPGVSSVALQAGTSYLAEASGTWTNQGGANPVDTEYSTVDGWATQMDGYTGYQTDILELQINNVFDPNSNWGAYNSAHKYAQSFIPSIAGPANFRIFDGSGTTQNEGWFGDNNGPLTVDISKGYAGITGETGCVTFTDVPFGSYTVGEILQDGWNYDSGAGQAAIDSTQESFTIINREIPKDSSVFVCKKDPSGAGLPGWQVQLYKSNAVENLFVPSTTGTPVSFAPVVAGDYILRAKGDYTYRPGTPGAEYSDAGWSKRAPSDSVYVGAFLPWVKVSTFPSPNTGWLGVMVNDDTADWGTYFNPAHTYVKSFENYGGGVISAKILDDVYSDNSGGVSLDLHEGYTGVTNDEDGCVTFADVPYGDYYLDETGRDGWENVSGIGPVTIDTTQESFDIVNQETVIPLIPQIAVDKTGPQFSMENSPITYNYSVTNPGQAPLSSVTVADDKCSTPAYVSGDMNADSKLDLTETWLFSCTTTPTWSFNTTLTNTATASGVYDQTTVTSTDLFSLQSVVMRKDVVLQSGDGTTEYSDPNTQFSVEVKQGATVLGTTTISESAPANMWLAPGQYSFCEVNLPTGYTAHYQNCYNFNTNSYPDFTQINILTPAKIVASKVVCDEEQYLPNNTQGVIGATTAQDWVTAHPDHCQLETDWDFQWAPAETGTFGEFQTNTASLTSPWTTFGAGETVAIPNASAVGGRIEVREVFPDNTYVPFSNAGNVSAELWCTGDQANYDNWEWVNTLQSGQTYYCVGFNAPKSAPRLTLIKRVIKDDGGTAVPSDWTVSATGPGPLVQGPGTAVSDDDTFLPGTYTMTESGGPVGYVASAWSCIGDGALVGNQITLGLGDRAICTITNDDSFGNVTVTKYNDLNGDGTQDQDEPSLSGWNIHLDRIEAATVTEQTDENGVANFSPVLPGEYTLSETIQPGWMQTNIDCFDESESLHTTNNYSLTMIAGQQLNCSIGNQEIQSRLLVSKENNAYPAIKAPGDTVKYTLTVTAKEGSLDDVLLTDVPPDGFSYVLGSWTAVSDVRGDIKNSVTTEPTYGSPGDWILGTMIADEVVTLTYDAKIDSEITSGIHPDLAYAYGNQIDGPTVYAVAQDPGFVSEDFAGTQVQVAVNNPGGTLGHEVERKETVSGQVLGASTELPATGMPVTLPLIGFGMFITGLITLLAGLFIRRRHALARVASGLGVALFILIGLVAPASAFSPLSLRVEQLPSPYNQKEFKLRYVVLDIENRPITVTCFRKAPDAGGFSSFSSPTAIQAGGDNHYCNVTGDMTGVAGTYQFYVMADAGSDTFTSPIQAVDLRTNTGPGTPTNYSRDRQSCKDKLTFRSADDSGKTARIEVYRSDNRSFTADSGSRIDNFGAGSNENFTKEYDRPDCSKSYYFVVRAFDSANNGSGLVGDTETIVTTVNTTTTTTTTQPTGALPVPFDEGTGTPARTGGSILGAADLFDDVTDLNNDGVIDEAELAAASESAKVAAAAQQKADQEKNQASQGAVLGTAVSNFFSSIPVYAWWILGAVAILLLIAAAARFL